MRMTGAQFTFCRPSQDYADEKAEETSRIETAIGDAKRTGSKKGVFGLFARTQMARRIRAGTHSRAANALVERMKKEGF